MSNLPNPPVLLRGRAYQAHTTSACDTCAAHCCTGRNKFGFTNVRIEEWELHNPVLRQLAKTIMPSGGYGIPIPEDGECPMLEAGRCTIYHDRPEACRNFTCIELLDTLRMSEHRSYAKYQPWLRHMRKLKLIHGDEQTAVARHERATVYRCTLHLVHVGRGQFIVRGVWHGEAFTAALRAIPTAYRWSLARQAQKLGWEIAVERGRLTAIHAAAYNARSKGLMTATVDET